MEGTRPGDIVVLAGVNGAGKSSVAGAALRSRGGTFYNPDEATRAYVFRGLPAEEANSRAWHRGREQLGRAIRDGGAYAFETTLGGRSITRLLLEASAVGRRVRVWYVGLGSPELHVQRVRERLARGGHDIPVSKIRHRWTASRENLIRLIPHLFELVVFDNSVSAALDEGEAPRPVRLLHVRDGIRFIGAPNTLPGWAKPIVEAAIQAHGPS